MTDETPDPTPEAPRPPRSSDEPRLSSQRQRELALAEVLQLAEAREVVVRSPTPPRGTTPGRAAVAAVLVAVAIWVWVAPPPFLRPTPAPSVDEVRQEAGLRFGAALQAQRIRAHRAETRRLPDQLREVEDTLPGMVYRRRDAASFVLRARSGSVAVEYVSDTPLREFLGESLLRLGGEG